MKHAEVIIIGGGIVGSATAYYLAKRGVKDVIVLESSASIGHGASSRNGGGVRQSGRDVRELPVAMLAVEKFWPTLSKELGVDTEYTQEGNLRLGKTEAHMKKLNQLADNCKAMGLDVRMVDKQEAHRINPYLSDDVIGASFCPTDGHANPLTTTLGYYMRALEMGVHFYTHAMVASLKKVKGKVSEVVMSDGEVLSAKTIILAAGYASRAIMNTIGLDIPMDDVIDGCIVTEMEPKMFGQMLGTAAADFYGHQTHHGSFVFGAVAGPEAYMDIAPETTNFAHPDTLGATCRAVEGYIPALAHSKIVRSWTGWCDCTSDGVCVLGPVEEAPGLILACGFNGHGFGTAPAVAYMLAQMTCGEEPLLNLSALRYERFYD
ncbi:NAD(P)/FAD-dependent oxidoreductase [Sharpea azabuensis]